MVENELRRPTLECSPDRRDAEQIDARSGRFKLDDQAQALGEAPKDTLRRQAWRQVQYTVKHAKDEEQPAKVGGWTASATVAKTASAASGWDEGGR